MNHRRSPRGYTLIELLLVMSVAVVLMMVNVGWIHQTMKFSSLMKQRQRHHQNLTRLSRDLRDDVRNSKTISMDGENRLVLKLNDDAIVAYAISATSVEVERLNNETMIARESFELAPESNAYWDTSEMPDWISLVVARGRDGLAGQTATESNPTTIAMNQGAADLHVRVRPNRWDTSLAKLGPDENEEGSK